MTTTIRNDPIRGRVASFMIFDDVIDASSYAYSYWGPNMPKENFHLKRIGKKRWGVFCGSSARVIHEIRGAYPSAKEQFTVWKVTRRLGLDSQI